MTFPHSEPVVYNHSLSLARPFLLGSVLGACALVGLLLLPMSTAFAASGDSKNTPVPPALLSIQKQINKGQFEKALAGTEDYLKKTPDDSRARFMQGVALSELGRSAEAMTVFTRLTEDTPEMAEPYNNLAVLHAQKGDYTQAREVLEMAIRVNPSYATAHENLGDVYVRMASQEYRQAQSKSSASLSLGPKLKALNSILSTPPNGAGRPD